MGLDFVEIMMSCEDAFDIRIRDREIETVRTAGDLHALVMRLLNERRGEAVCASSQMFYRLRQDLMKIGMPRRMIRPQTSVAEIVEELGEERWPAVRSVLEIPRSLPKPTWAEALMLGGAIASGVAAKLVGGEIWLGVIAGIAAGYLLHVALRPVRVPSESHESLREITYTLLSRQHRRPKGNVSEAEAWQVVRGILADEFAIASQDSSRTWEQGEKLQAVQDLQMRRARATLR